MNKNFKTIKLNKPVWVIGDVHGEYKKLIKLLKKIPKKDAVCFVGDVIDRGKDSRKVLNLIRDKKYFIVRGNHEEFMSAALDKKYSKDMFPQWIRGGGVDTIKGYVKNFNFRSSNDFQKLLKNKEIIKDKKWIDTLPLIIKFEFKNKKPLYISHSGLKLYKSDKTIKKENNEYSILLNRKKMKQVNFAVNIHGHTIVSKKDMKISKSQIDVDTGAYLKKGYLTAIKYPSMKRISVK